MDALLNQIQALLQEMQVIPADRKAGVIKAENREKYREETELMLNQLLIKVRRCLSFVDESVIRRIRDLQKQAQAKMNEADEHLKETRQAADKLRESFESYRKSVEASLEADRKRLDSLEAYVLQREWETQKEQSRLSEVSVSQEREYVERRRQLETEHQSRMAQLEEEYSIKIADAEALRGRLGQEYHIKKKNLEASFEASFYERLEAKLHEVTEEKTQRLNKLIAEYTNRMEILRKREGYVAQKWNEVSAQIAHLKLSVELESVHSIT